MMQWMICAVLMLFMQAAHAQKATESVVKIIHMTEPAQSNGIQIGTILTRQIALEIAAPYQLSTETLPMKGVRRDGIELHDVHVKTSADDAATRYDIQLQYQVFAAEFAPVVLQLPAEKIAVTGGSQALSVNLPVWRFWFSPLVPKGISNAKENMQPQFKPTLIAVQGHHLRFWIALAMLVAGLAGLVYINADKRWLPFMNGAFANAHRKLKKLPRNKAGEKQALVHMHQALNQINGSNLFASQLDEFLIKHPAFAPFKTQISDFFALSNQSLFADTQPHHDKIIAHLIGLSRQLRDCERGV